MLIAFDSTRNEFSRFSAENKNRSLKRFELARTKTLIHDPVHEKGLGSWGAWRDRASRS